MLLLLSIFPIIHSAKSMISKEKKTIFPTRKVTKKNRGGVLAHARKKLDRLAQHAGCRLSTWGAVKISWLNRKRLTKAEEEADENGGRRRKGRKKWMKAEEEEEEANKGKGRWWKRRKKRMKVEEEEDAKKSGGRGRRRQRKRKKRQMKVNLDQHKTGSLIMLRLKSSREPGTIVLLRLLIDVCGREKWFLRSYFMLFCVSVNGRNEIFCMCRPAWNKTLNHRTIIQWSLLKQENYEAKETNNQNWISNSVVEGKKLQFHANEISHCLMKLQFWWLHQEKQNPP